MREEEKRKEIEKAINKRYQQLIKFYKNKIVGANLGEVELIAGYKLVAECLEILNKKNPHRQNGIPTLKKT